MEKIRQLFIWTKSLPIWIRLVVYILIMALSFLFTLYPLSSCGITQSTINNIQSDSARVEMTVDPSQSTSTSVSTEIPLIK